MFLPLFSAAVLAIVFLIQLILKKRSKLASLKKIPGLPPRFLTGNIGWLLKFYLHKSEIPYEVRNLERVLGQFILYGQQGLMSVWIGPLKPIVFCSSPESVELVLSSSSTLEKSFEYKFLLKWLGQGLLTSTVSNWRPRRKLLTPSFHFRILDDFLPTFNEQSMVLVRKLESLVDEDFVDIEPLAALCTLDIVCETVMGVSIGAQVGGNSKYVAAVQSLTASAMKRIHRPWLWSNFVYDLTSSGKRTCEDLNTLHSFTNSIIQKKKEILMKRTADEGVSKENGNEFETKKRQAFMDLLLDMHMNGNKLSEEDIRDQTDTFMFGGHDTTAMGITYALYCIGLYPDVQRNIVEELDGIFGQDMTRPVTYDDARNMKYLESTLKEAQRLFPSVPAIGRILQKDIHFGEMVIPEGTTVTIHILGLHRRPDVYPNPEVFDPDRFQPDNVVKRHPYAFIPFSAGPRNCIGQKFALLEEKVIISTVLRRLKVTSLDPRDKVLVKHEFTLKPVQPIRLKFTPRNETNFNLNFE